MLGVTKWAKVETSSLWSRDPIPAVLFGFGACAFDGPAAAHETMAAAVALDGVNSRSNRHLAPALAGVDMLTANFLAAVETHPTRLEGRPADRAGPGFLVGEGVDVELDPNRFAPGFRPMLAGDSAHSDQFNFVAHD
jgi:hypothetical protein